MSKMPSTVNLPTAVEDGGSLRITLSSGARVVTRPDGADIEMLWQAELYELRPRAKPRYLGRFVTDIAPSETPATLLRQLADIYEAGELPVQH